MCAQEIKKSKKRVAIIQPSLPELTFYVRLRLLRCLYLIIQMRGEQSDDNNKSYVVLDTFKTRLQ